MLSNHFSINNQSLNLENLIDINGLRDFNVGIRRVINNKMKEAVNSGLKIQTFTSKLELPAGGDGKTIYINTTDKEIWLWDTRLLKFYCFGSDYHNIKIIDGGSSTSI